LTYVVIRYAWLSRPREKFLFTAAKCTKPYSASERNNNPGVQKGSLLQLNSKGALPM
jgi:hypothetical protein